MIRPIEQQASMLIDATFLACIGLVMPLLTDPQSPRNGCRSLEVQPDGPLREAPGEEVLHLRAGLRGGRRKVARGPGFDQGYHKRSHLVSSSPVVVALNIYYIEVKKANLYFFLSPFLNAKAMIILALDQQIWVGG